MSKKGTRPAKSQANNTSNSKIGVKANKDMHRCFSSCANAVMKLIDGKVVQYCPVYTEPCQEAIKVCEVK